VVIPAVHGVLGVSAKAWSIAPHFREEDYSGVATMALRPSNISTPICFIIPPIAHAKLD
jgi:hypothetical protein